MASPAVFHPQQPGHHATPPIQNHGPTPGSMSVGRKMKFTLEDIQVLNTLGTGSFGRVHLTKHKASGQYFAMKVLKKLEIVRLKQVEHTMNEKSILEKLDHPFIVNMFGSFQDPHNLYIVLEYVSGGEMFSFLRRSGVSIYLLLVLLFL